MIEYYKFKKSLKHLELQFENYRGLDDRDDLTELDQEAIAESVIQRFEVPNSPKPVFRLAEENNLFRKPSRRWLQYADARTATAHDYSGEKAEDCLETMKDFVDDAIDLFQTLTGKT